MNKSKRPFRKIEHEMFDLINKEREKKGLKKYTFSDELSYVGYLHAVEQLHAENIFHKSPKTGTIRNRLEEHGISYKSCGENVATSPSLIVSHDGLMKSSGHRANILHQEFTHIGIGIAKNSKRQLYITQIFLQEIPIFSKSPFTNLLEDINSLRTKKGLSKIKEIPLQTLRTFANRLKYKEELSEISFNPQQILDDCQKELSPKNIYFHSLSLSYGVRFDYALVKDFEKTLSKTNLTAMSFCVEQNPINKGIIVLLLFYYTNEES